MHAGNWSWIDNSVFDFNDWNKGEPQNAGACIAVSMANGSWSSQDCFKPKPFVCNVTPTPTSAPYIQCPLGWAYFTKTESCYGAGNIPHQKMTWEEAEERCEEQQAHLVSIHSYEEYLFCESYDLYAWGGPFWTGLRSDDGGKTWKWSDDTPFDYQYWGDGAPKATDGCATCGLEKLTVKNCSEIYLFICKKSAFLSTDSFAILN
uniref:C-type lectin domain-containing protein n=1 Tax=Panagrolaimus davidi TaxID=227884 RepID=A0A914PLJ8_9BILA